MEKDILWNLECAEVNLQDDIQALAYIQDTCETTKKEDFLLSQTEIRNQLQTLLKSMIYNHENMKRAIDEYYKKIGKKEVNNNGCTSINNSENQEAEKVQA